MIVNIARFLFNVGLVIGGLGGAFVLFSKKPELSFQLAFWGLLTLFILKGITKMSPAFAVFWRKVKCRMIVFRECFLVGLVYGICTYVVAGLGGAALEGAGWSGAVDALITAPKGLSPAGALAFLFPTFGIIVGLFGGNIQLSPSSFTAPTNSHVVLWFLAHSDLFTVSRNVDRSVIRGRMIQGYAQSFRKLIGGTIPHLWFVFNDRLATWKRRIERFFSKLSALSFISFEEKPTIDMATPCEDLPNGNAAPRNESKAEDSTPKPVRSKKKAVTKSEKASEHKERNGQSQTSNSRKLLGWVQDTLILEKSNVSHPPIVLEAKVKKRKTSVRTLRIFWAYSFISFKEALGHFLVVGTPGSGKTVQIRLLMQSVFKNFGKGLNQRAVVYDGKREYIPILQGMDLKVPIHILNPFDARSVPWNIAEDINTPAAAWQIASIFIPDEQSVQPFFAEASRQLLYGVFFALLKTRSGKWTLRDVILICRNKERLSQVLLLTEETKEIRENYFSEQKTLNGILSTLDTKLAPLRIVAALWDWSVMKKGAVGVSVSSWIEGESIFVLGNHPRFSESVSKINAALLRTFSDVVVSQPDTDLPSSWFFLDELREGPKVEGLASLSNQGRSKGVVLTMGIQNTSGFTHVYTEKLAEEILGQTRFKSVLRIDSHETAKWVQQHFGEQLVIETNRSVGSSSGGSYSRGYQSQGGFNDSHTQNWGTNDSASESHQLRPTVLAADVQGFHPPTPETGFRGVHDVPSVGVFYTHLSWNWIMDNLAPVKGEGCIEREDAEQELRCWTSADSERLGLKKDEADGTDEDYFK